MSVASEAWITLRSLLARTRTRFADQSGEGVISTAMAVDYYRHYDQCSHLLQDQQGR